MKLLQSFPKTAFLLSSILFVSVSGARKHHHKTSTTTSAASSPVTTQIVESDHVSAQSASLSQASMQMAQSRSTAALANERAAIASERASNAGYSQPIYSSPYDPSMMAEPSVQESYYDPMIPTAHHHHQHQQYTAASGLYHHHVPAPAGVGVPHARHAGAVAGAAAASSVAPYAAAPYAAHQGYYQGYGYDYPNRYVAQGSHQDAYVAKRAHGYGGGYGWHPDLEIQTLFFIGIPLIIIPLLFLWPYFLYSLHYRGGGHHGGFGYRSGDGDAEVVSTPEKELKKKTDELTKKVVPKLSKKSDKSSKSSSDKSSSKSSSTKSK